MKNVFLFGLALTMTGFFAGCAQEDLTDLLNQSVDARGGVVVSNSSDDDIEQVPQAILDYIAANYPDAQIIHAEEESDDNNGAVVYEIHLTGGLDIYFDADGNFLFAETHGDQDDQDVPVSDLSQAILDYVAANYPEETITSASLEDNGNYEVNLSNHLELYFDANGNFLFADGHGHGHDDDEDGPGNDDDDIDPTTLAQNILDYIAANYPGLTIDHAHAEDGGFEVELSDGTELLFDADGNFLSVEVDDDEDGPGNGGGNNDDDDDDEDGPGNGGGNNDDDDDDDEDGPGNGGGNDNNIDPATLAQNILDYIAANYPGLTIDHAHAEDGGFEVELSDGTELLFDADGNFLGIETDGDGG